MLTLRVGPHREIPPEFYGTPKEIWGFRVPRARGSPAAIGRRFIADNEALFGHRNIRGRFKHRKTLESLGATHVIFQQQHLKWRIHRAYVTVHIGPEGRVYMAKNRAIPANLLPVEVKFDITKTDAQETARNIEELRDRVEPVRVFRAVEELWYPRKKGLRPAYKVRLSCTEPRADWIVYVDAERNKVLEKFDNLAQQHRFGAVFDPNPVVALGVEWKQLRGKRGGMRQPPPAAVRVVELIGLDGSGFLHGPLVTTRPTPERVKRKNGQFLFTPEDPAFAECMAYFHVSSAMAYLQELGFAGTRRIPFKLPLEINVRATREDNSFYDPGLKQLQFGLGKADDAHDAEVILHEFGHAVQDAIVPDFGQRPEGWALGEGFGDYLAASFFADRKSHNDRTRIMGWDGFLDSTGNPPFLRRVDSSRTRASFEEDGDEHDNGEIWSATLWDIREALGRKVADTLIIESHFQLDGFAGFDHAVRAIMDADRNVYDGRHVTRLRLVFRRRGFEPG
jgi:hypothetical protein